MDFKWILVRLGGLLGTSWGVLGRLGGVLGASWRVLGASWAHLGASWERLGGVLGASWRVLERLGTSWAPSSLQDRKKLEKPTKNHQKPPQHKPDLIWNGKRRFLFDCLLLASLSYTSLLERFWIAKPASSSWTLRSLRSLRSLARCARLTVVSFRLSFIAFPNLF